MSANGAETELLVRDGSAFALNCRNGWLYYSSGARILQTNIYTLSSDVLSENLSGKLFVIKEVCYILTEDGLSLLNLLNGEITGLNSLSSVESLNVEGESLFFINGDSRALFCSALSGGALTKILDGDVRSVCLFEGNLFCSVSNGGGKEILRIDVSGSEPETIAEADALSLNVTADGIYYIDAADETIHLCSFDGRLRRRISKNSVADFNIAGGWIFYHNRADNGRLWCVRTDGANDHPVQTGR